MSELVKNVYSNYPFIVKAKSRGYYDYKSTQTIVDSSNIVLDMKKFEGLETSLTETDNYPLIVSTKEHTLPNWHFIDDTKNVFMNVGKNYKSICEYKNNYYLINNGCTESEGVYSGFNSSKNKLTLNKKFPSDMTSMEIVTKAMFTENGSHSTLFGRNSGNDGTIIIRNNSGFKFGYYHGSWTWESSAPEVELNKWHWFKVIWDGTNLTGYMLEDNSYTLDTLPEISSWSQCWQSTDNIFTGNSFDIGYNKNSTGEYCKGSIDLANTKIVVNDDLFFAYNQQTLVKYSLNGCLYNYTDTGIADTLNMFSVEKDNQDTAIILTKEESPTIENSVVTYLGQTNVPEHKVYSYSEVDGYEPFDVTLVGTDATYDISTYQFNGSKASESYLKLNYDLKESDNLEIITKVKFNDVSSSAAVFCSSTNVWWIGETRGKFGGYLNGSKTSNFTLEANKTYWLKIVEDRLNLKLYAVEDNNYSINNVPFGDAVYTSSRYGLTKNGFVFGANIGYNSENLDGTIYLKDSKFVVNDEAIFGNVVVGNWVKK